MLVGVLVAVFLWRGIPWRVRAADLGEAGLVQTAHAEEAEQVEGGEALAERIVELAQGDHIELLEWCQERYQNSVKDYTTRFYKQERLKGKLKKAERVSVQFMEKPFSVLMKWEKNAGRTDKLLFVEGKNDGKMLVHPTGFFSWIKSVKREPWGKDAKKSGLKSCEKFGFYRSMESMLGVYRKAREKGELETKYVGRTEVDERPCVQVERLLPKGKGYPAARLVVDFDLEYGLPTRVSSYDWEGRLVSQYRYTEVKFNTGLTEDDFTAKASGL